MVQHEVDQNLTQVRNSATDALMWLRRALWFLSEFLREFTRSYSAVPSECLYAGYQVTLRQHHNWVVRGIFSLAMRSMPNNEDFIRNLVVNPSDLKRHKHAIVPCVSVFFSFPICFHSAILFYFLFFGRFSPMQV
jgi:pleckstrin family protein A (phosphoinositide binding specific) protein 8